MDAVSLKGLERVISVTIGGDSLVDSAAAKTDIEHAAGGATRAAEVDNLMGSANTLRKGTEYEEDKKLPVVHFRTYQLSFLRSGLPTPIAALAPHGPHFTFSMRRSQLPSTEMWKAALKKTVKKKAGEGRKKSKNEDIDSMGDKVGRVYIDPQDFSSLQARKQRGLRRTPEEKKERELAKKVKTAADAGVEYEVMEVEGKVGGGEGRKRAAMQ